MLVLKIKMNGCSICKNCMCCIHFFDCTNFLGIQIAQNIRFYADFKANECHKILLNLVYSYIIHTQKMQSILFFAFLFEAKTVRVRYRLFQSHHL